MVIYSGEYLPVAGGMWVMSLRYAYMYVKKDKQNKDTIYQIFRTCHVGYEVEVYVYVFKKNVHN